MSDAEHIAQIAAAQVELERLGALYRQARLALEEAIRNANLEPAPALRRVK